MSVYDRIYSIELGVLLGRVPSERRNDREPGLNKSNNIHQDAQLSLLLSPSHSTPIHRCRCVHSLNPFCFKKAPLSSSQWSKATLPAIAIPSIAA